MLRSIDAIEIFVVFIIILQNVDNSHEKYMSRCEFVREFIKFNPQISHHELNQWTCIAQYQTNFNSSVINFDAEGTGYYGIFQISDRYWCSKSSYIQRQCNIQCNQLQDQQLTNDFECLQQIYGQHLLISGNGFSAWPVHNLHCLGHYDLVKDCLTGVSNRKINNKNYENNIFLSGQGDFKIKTASDRKKHKIYERCELARELYYVHDIPFDQIAKWVCIAKYESNYNTSAVGHLSVDGSGDHGIFQINDIYWCSPPGKGWVCGLSCAKLENADISDDVQCMMKIFNEHKRLSGDGFNAWTVYQPYCKQNAEQFISGCFDHDSIDTNIINAPAHKPAIFAPNQGNQIGGNIGKTVSNKVYSRCELAQELRYKHNISKDQIHVWLCIAQQQSSLKTSAVSSDGGSYGLFQISDKYWCSTYGNGKACGINCLQLIDSDILDDVQCARKIFDEHQRIYGNGFQAWQSYESYCKYQTAESTRDCFDDESYSSIHNSVVPLKMKTVKKAEKGKVYERCELAKELRYTHNIPKDQIPTWVCIAHFQSNFITSAASGTEHGIFQISNKYWCSLWGSGKGCGISCANLEDSDITDDIQCVQKIYAEHQRLFGDGFSAWSSYLPYCKDQSAAYTRDCFTDEQIRIAPTPQIVQNSIATPSIYSHGKIYERCELAKDLRFKHNMPRDQIHMWVCIAQHESNFNTAAVGRLNADGSGDHGIFQISDLFWCSINDIDNKGCGVSCSKFEDSNITDDVECIKKIHKEHQQLFGDGFHAWAVYEPYCKHQTTEYTRGCFEDEIDSNNAIIPVHNTQLTSSYTYSNKRIEKNEKAYERCELAKELRTVHNIPREQISDWVCIALYQSNLATSAVGVREHGIFQISDEYWCTVGGSPNSRGCGIDCAKLEDADITDDVKCARKIFDEHQRMSGNGFSAWTVYEPYCQGKSAQYTEGCFADEKYIQNKVTVVKAPAIKPQQVTKTSNYGKVYKRCELAKELRYSYNLPFEQIHTWVCIAQQQSRLNTSALGPLNAIGSQSYGLFQINEKFWCSNDGNGGKGCTVSCSDLIDDNIADDIQCVQRIFNEHQRIFGNGFQAWTSYESYCKYQSDDYTRDCFDVNGDISNSIVPVHSAPVIPYSQVSKAKIYDRCELARELRYKHNMARDKLHMWVCIAEHESRFDTSAVGRLNADGSGDHGLFQISDLYWCSVSGQNDKACGLPCSKLVDSDITDDVRCMKKIYDEHQRLFGDGFNAWTVYKPHCKHKTSAMIDDCFDIIDNNLIPQQSEMVLTTTFATNPDLIQSNGKIYTHCELAHELRNKHLIPIEQIATWVCIAMHESTFNTSAIGHTNPDGSGDHGLFQISDVYWCSPPGNGWSCGLSCANLEDNDITDDVECIKKIYNEHQQLSGDGFNAWKVYIPFCKGKSDQYIEGCFADTVPEISTVAAPSIVTSTEKSTTTTIKTTTLKTTTTNIPTTSKPFIQFTYSSKPAIASTTTRYKYVPSSTIAPPKSHFTTARNPTTLEKSTLTSTSTTVKPPYSTTINLFDLYLKKSPTQKPTRYVIPSFTTKTITSSTTTKSPIRSTTANRLNTYRIPNIQSSTKTAKPHHYTDTFFQNFFNTQVSKLSTGSSDSKSIIISGDRSTTKNSSSSWSANRSTTKHSSNSWSALSRTTTKSPIYFSFTSPSTSTQKIKPLRQSSSTLFWLNRNTSTQSPFTTKKVKTYHYSFSGTTKHNPAASNTNVGQNKISLGRSTSTSKTPTTSVWHRTTTSIPTSKSPTTSFWHRTTTQRPSTIKTDAAHLWGYSFSGTTRKTAAKNS